jgi:hypothetical protein
VKDQERSAGEHVAAQTSPARRLLYRSPALVEYGNVSKLTEGANGSIPDSNSMGTGMMGHCL